MKKSIALLIGATFASLTLAQTPAPSVPPVQTPRAATPPAVTPPAVTPPAEVKPAASGTTATKADAKTDKAATGTAVKTEKTAKTPNTPKGPKTVTNGGGTAKGDVKADAIQGRHVGNQDRAAVEHFKARRSVDRSPQRALQAGKVDHAARAIAPGIDRIHLGQSRQVHTPALRGPNCKLVMVDD